MALAGHKNWAVNNNGTVLPGTAIEVRRAADGTPAALFTDATGGTPVTNPFTADGPGGAEPGSYEFYAAPDRYNVLVGSGGSQVSIPLDLTDGRAQVPFDTRANFVAWVGGGGAAAAGTIKIAAGYQYIATPGATAISDLPGWLPMGRMVSHRHFTDATGTADFTTAVHAAIDYVSSSDGLTLDGGGETVYLASTYDFSGFNERTVRNFRFRPHTSWVSSYPGDGNSIWTAATPPDHTAFQTTPFFRIPSGAGNVEIARNFFDGRNTSGVTVADFVLWQAGGNRINDNTIRGFANYGVWIVNGTDGQFQRNDIFQRAFDEPENGTHDTRTAAGEAIATGDIEDFNNIIHGCQYPLTVYGSGASTFTKNHYYNGAAGGSEVATTGSTYNVRVYRGSRPVFNGTYFDNGAIRLETPQVQFQGCRYLMNDAAVNDPFFFELAPQVANDPLNGFMVLGGDFQGSKSGAAIPAADFFRVDTTNGTLTGSEDNVIVEDNSYHFGTATGTRVPSTSGTFRVRVLTGDWVPDGSNWETTRLDVSDRLFMSDLIDYNFVHSAETRNGTPVAHVTSDISAMGILFRSTSNEDVNMHVVWDGRANELITL